MESKFIACVDKGEEDWCGCGIQPRWETPPPDKAACEKARQRIKKAWVKKATEAGIGISWLRLQCR